MKRDGVHILTDHAAVDAVLTADARVFLSALHRRFDARRRALLDARAARQVGFDAGERPSFLPETADVRNGSWQVNEAPDDLQNRRVEITGPAAPKMMINALNSGANVFMADLEDALSPTWANVLEGQIALGHAVRRQLRHVDPASGKEYSLAPSIAALVVRPRGWHLDERNVLVDGEPMSASLFDAGLYLFHNAHELLARGTGPYFYLPKLEGHLEARLWNDVFEFSETELGLTPGAVRPTVLIETITAAFEMEEILFELRERVCGLNAGRWDYIFSAIKKLHAHPGTVLPDRAQVSMTVPFMRAYAEFLVRCCHLRGAHAIGGMAAFVPKRGDPELNEVAFSRVREDKQREASQGFDGTWVAHPDLVTTAREAFDALLGAAPHQKHVVREATVAPEDLLAFQVPDGTVSEAGVRNNLSVGLQYLAAWLSGQGAVAIFNLMEDAATAEIARAQLWQWLRAGVTVAEEQRFDEARYLRWRSEELSKLQGSVEKLDEASDLLDQLVLSPDFPEFLTTLAYESLG